MSTTIKEGDLVKTVCAVRSWKSPNDGWINQGTVGKVIFKSSFRCYSKTVYTVDFRKFSDTLYITAIKKLTKTEEKLYKETLRKYDELETKNVIQS